MRTAKDEPYKKEVKRGKWYDFPLRVDSRYKRPSLRG